MKIRDNDFPARLEFNKQWWNAAAEGEVLAQAEITEVRWLIQQIERLNEGWEVMTQVPMDMHWGEVRAFARKMVKGEAPFRLNEPYGGEKTKSKLELGTTHGPIVLEKQEDGNEQLRDNLSRFWCSCGGPAVHYEPKNIAPYHFQCVECAKKER